MNNTKDPNVHPDMFFIALEENNNFLYKETIQRGIKNLSENTMMYFIFKFYPKKIFNKIKIKL